jgi:hypothetical protein
VANAFAPAADFTASPIAIFSKENNKFVRDSMRRARAAISEYLPCLVATGIVRDRAVLAKLCGLPIARLAPSRDKFGHGNHRERNDRNEETWGGFE